ncbi:E3 ubiquitin-protein ligase XIAP-like [Watersipora subatra]|uniref:E3 ubiquitin-protein ligase XIAP-like n=1 Tax=Watersipora subatra TaxID=2589382 RepID=UPI00355AE374
MFNPLKHGIQSAVLPTQREILCYPVARYPDNQNPLLPLSLQKKLGAMSPKEFLETVLHELSLDERESLLIDEKHRRTTFLVNWPHDGNLSGIKMAQAGFYCVGCSANHSDQTHNDQEDNYYAENGLDWMFNPLRHGLQSAVLPNQKEIFCYPLARYPDNQNPLLPLSLQKKLGAMSPREFLNTVLRELSLDERESLLVDEKQRITTFLVNWPHDGNLSGIKMAQAGFYCVDDYDRVQCVFCRGSLHKWEEGDNPMTEHAKMFPFCKFPKGLECGNKEYRIDVLGAEDLEHITFLCAPDGGVPINCENLGISTNKAAIKKVSSINSRKNTFARWPASNALDAGSLWEADNSDRVQCVFCRGIIHQWEEGDNPMTEHAKLFPFCKFPKGLECGNQDYRSDVLGAEELKNITFLCVQEMEKNRDGSVTTNSIALGINTNNAVIMRYSTIDSRINTFDRWPASNALAAGSLWEAGFYYTGFGDQVRCSFCAGELQNWAVGDDPWQEHARWFPDCPFLIQNKGEAYVNEVHRTTADGKKCSRQNKAVTEHKQKVSDRKAMYDLCVNLGHERRLVDLAINRNGRAFDNAKDLVEAIYKLEEEENMRMEVEISPQEGMARVMNGDQQMLRRMQTDGVELTRPLGACFNCFNWRRQTVNATEVALPCGHLIFCDHCGQDEKDRVDNNPSYKSKCPYQGCCSLMTGLFKTYFN